MATSLDDVWAWPEEPCEKHNYINWRVEGTEGFAEENLAGISGLRNSAAVP